jgi:hypothetical protein
VGVGGDVVRVVEIHKTERDRGGVHSHCRKEYGGVDPKGPSLSQRGTRITILIQTPSLSAASRDKIQFTRQRLVERRRSWRSQPGAETDTKLDRHFAGPQNPPANTFVEDVGS